MAACPRRVPWFGLAPLVIAAMTAALAAGCGDAPAPPARPGAATTAAAKLTGPQACRLLRGDLVRHRGVPGIPTLRRIADHVDAAPRLAADARTAVRDIDHTGVAPLAISLLRGECARAGVPIPPP